MQTSNLSGGARTNNPGSGARIIGSGGARADGPGPDVMAADTLEDTSVLSSDGEKVGKIKHIMLDVGSGRIAYAVLSSGGFLGMGDKLLAIPWRALTLDTDNKAFVLNVMASEVENAPGFDKDHWPAMADPQWASGIHDYYRTTRYWDDERVVLDEPPLDEPVTRVPPGSPL
jgi:sporulation protein YlmC with PRC-barrel domain